MPSSRILPTLRTCLRSLLSAGLCAGLGAACANSRMGAAEVRLQDGQPCFTLTAKEGARSDSIRLKAVVVSDDATNPAAPVWSVVFDPARPQPISAASCVAYGRVPDGATIIQSAKPLTPNKVYDVYLNGRSTDPSDSTQGYAAKFCLVADTAGVQRVMPVERGSRAWDEGVCR